MFAEPYLPPLAGKAEEREAGYVDAIGLILVCGNRSIHVEHGASERAPSPRQRNALRKKAKFLENGDMGVTTQPSVTFQLAVSGGFPNRLHVYQYAG